MFLVRYSGTGVVVGLFLLSKWGFVRVAALALVIQLPPNILLQRGFASLPTDFFVKSKKREATDAQQRQVDRLVAEIAARAGVEAPAVWLTGSISRIAAGIFERMLIINPSFYYSLSKQARRGVIAHEIAHQYDQASRERLVTDLGIFVPSGIADAAIVLDLLGRVQLDGAALSACIVFVIIGKLALAKLSRINERQADLLATDILGEKKPMLAVCEEVSRRYPDPLWLPRARLLRTHPSWQKRRLAVEKHKLRRHPRRLWPLANAIVALIPWVTLIAAGSLLAGAAPWR